METLESKTKKCTKCREVKEATNQFFAKARGGLAACCKICKNKQNKVRRLIRQADPVLLESYRKYQREYRSKRMECPEYRFKQYDYINKLRKSKAYKETQNKYARKKRTEKVYGDRIREYHRSYQARLRADTEYRNKERAMNLQRDRKERETLTDRYIRYSILRVRKNEDVPPELIETKRLIIQLKRELKNGNKT